MLNGFRDNASTIHSADSTDSTIMCNVCIADRLLLLKGDALCSTKNATLAMSPLLEALTLAKRSHCLLLASVAAVHLAFVQVSPESLSLTFYQFFNVASTVVSSQLPVLSSVS